jgi:hypothetical protein
MEEKRDKTFGDTACGQMGTLISCVPAFSPVSYFLYDFLLRVSRILRLSIFRNSLIIERTAPHDFRRHRPS